MLDLIGLACFAVFVALGFRLRRHPAGPVRRRALNLLFAYALGLSLVVAVSQRDLWPFSTYTLAAFRPRVDRPICLLEFRAADGSGREWRLDPYTWSPIFDSTLQNWFDNRYGALTPGEQATALRFLLERAEAARLRLAAGRPIGYDRILGREFSAPYWWMLPRATAVPATPYTRLRVYEACRVPLEVLADPGRVRRVVRAEYP